MGIITNQPTFGSFYIVADNFDELRSVETIEITDGAAAIVTGALAIGDGQGGLFAWVSTSTEDDDDDAVIAPINDEPVPGRWLRLNAIRGEDGEDGVSPLPPAFTIGSVSSLPAGSAATATVTGTHPNYVVSFGIPLATNGTNATDPAFGIGTVTSLIPGQSPTVTLTGTYPTRTLNFGLPRGADGTNGTNGVTPTISGVNATTLPSGSSATASVTNTGGNSYSFTFGIPQGAAGSGGGGSGDMLKADNLSGLTNRATARSNLSLGSVSTWDVGTAAANIPQLDGSGRLPTSTMPESVIGAMTYKGTYDAFNNTVSTGGGLPAAAAANKGFYYVISTGGPAYLNPYLPYDTATGDWIVSNGSSYDKVDSSDQVNSVAGLQGSITAANLKTALNLSGTNTGDQTNISGNAATATKLQGPARTINGVAFDGSASITIYDNTKAPLSQPVSTYTGSVTATSLDANAFVRITSTSACVYTIQTNASVPFAVGTRIDLQQGGTGQLSVTIAGPVTIESDTGYLKLKGRFAGATLLKIATDTWTLIGALVA